MTRVAGLWLCLAGSAFGAASTSWEMTTWSDFLRGKFSGVALTREGALRAAAKSELAYSDGQSSIWCAAEARDGSLYFGTGARGQVVRLAPNGQSGVVATLGEPHVFAIAIDSKGVVFAATSPDGKIYRIENGRATEFYNPGEKYIWSLAAAPDGTLYAGTGENGKIYAIRAPGQGEVHYETGQVHVTALAIDEKGRLLAGTDPNGVLYRIAAKDQAFVVYDAPFPEIRSIVPKGDRLYVSAIGGSVAKRSAAAAEVATTSPVVVTAPATSITVEAQAGLELKPKTEAAKSSAVSSTVSTASPQILDLTGVDKSAIYRVAADGTVDTLWSSKEENAYDLLSAAEGVSFATDGPGRIYNLGDDRKIELLDQTNQSEVIRLFQAKTGLYAITSNPGQVLRLQQSEAAKGVYESPVHDAGSISRWGRLDWQGSGGTFRVRVGNSARPDKTWTNWSAPFQAPSQPALPNARYAQWQAELASGAAIDSVSLAYRPQNNPPSVKSITVTSQMVATAGQAKAVATPAGAAYSITVTDSGDSGASTMSGTATQNAGRSGSRQLVITWTGEDADGDTLTYNVSFRGEGETEWKPLKLNQAEATFTIEGDVLADGRYHFRVVASDRVANPPQDAREGELISSPVRIDNTPPTVTMTRQGSSVLIQAADGTSPLRRCEVSIDARPWVLVEAEDGVTDSRQEGFRLQLLNLTPGEHLITARVTDAAGNPGLAKLVVR